ncbi:hypothetical protein [Haloterrigena salinisoli]|uniref:hypothetical protein n=1 Tax=Haloterrigena salinisoli TaxID=3132747 RepID=UPI0030CA8BEA
MSVSLEAYYGAISSETATELETMVSERRSRRSSDRRDRVGRIAAIVDAETAD